jgi:hypothetical protein
MELEAFKERYIKYLNDELKDKTKSEQITWLKIYLIEKLEFYKILKEDLINNLDNYEELRNQFDAMAESLYTLFRDKDKLEEEI